MKGSRILSEALKSNSTLVSMDLFGLKKKGSDYCLHSLWIEQ